MAGFRDSKVSRQHAGFPFSIEAAAAEGQPFPD